MNIPMLGMGTFRLEDDVAYQSVKMALEEGFRHIDTAQIYGNEEQVGKAITDSGIARDELFVTTKVWNESLTTHGFLDSVHESLKKLSLERVDLLLIHWPAAPEGVEMEEYLAELLKAKELGLTREIGISNFTVAQMQQAAKILPQGSIYTNQVEVHPYLQNKAVRKAADDLGIKITGYMPFAVGKVLTDPVMKEIAEKHQAHPAQVAIAWSLQQGMISIPSSTKRANLQTNLSATDIRLDKDDMDKIATLDRNDRQANPDFAPNWDQ